MPQPVITAIGLGLDILGAALIAIPDARPLFSRFSAGALREAHHRMVQSGTREGNVGFDSLRKLLNEIEPVAEFGANHGGEEYTKIIVNSLSGIQTTETSEHPEFSWGDRYVEARYEEDGGWDRTDFYDVEDVFNAIISKERPQTAQLRLYGLLILLCGFTFQLLATLEANPVFPGLVAIVAIAACLGIFIFRDRLQ